MAFFFFFLSFIKVEVIYYVVVGFFFVVFCLFVCFCLFAFSRAAPVAYGGS